MGPYTFAKFIFLLVLVFTFLRVGFKIKFEYFISFTFLAKSMLDVAVVPDPYVVIDA
jgi:hypothetical protein